MNEMKIRRQNILNVASVPAIQEENYTEDNYNEFPLDKISAPGVTSEPLVNGIQTIINGGSGASGLYYVDTKGPQMAQFKDGSGYLGSLLTEGGTVGGGQAVMTPLACNPTMLFMAAVLMSVEKKLDDIKDLQKEISACLKAQDKARIRGNINVLSDIMDNYKLNWNNETYKTNKHILVQDIRKDAEQSIVLFREQIKKRVSKNRLMCSEQEAKGTLQKLQAEFEDYQLSLYFYAYSTFLEVMLLENFSEQYLDNSSARINNCVIQYRELYTECYNKLERLLKSSIQSIAVKGVSAASKKAGDAVTKIPVISKGPIDEGLISAGEKLGKMNSKKTRQEIVGFSGSAYTGCAALFSENLKTVNRIYNRPVEVLFDSENLYFVEDCEPDGGRAHQKTCPPISAFHR